MSKENDSWNQLTNYSESYMCNTFFETEGTKSTKNVPFTHVNIQGRSPAGGTKKIMSFSS